MRVLIFSISIAILLFGCNSGSEEKPTKTDNAGYIVGIDHFGRSFGTISSVKENKQVGLFFWLWIGQPYASGIYDATEILKLPNGLKILTDFASLDENISPNGQAHFWGEPIWKYYNSDDEWVIRKQMQMLTLAGIDFIFFDTTNSLIYKNVFMKILAVISEYMEKGWNPPKVIFYTHSKSIQTTASLYRELYKPGHYPETWYRIDGKPAIIAYTDVADDIAEAESRGDNNYSPEPLSEEILNFFHFFKPQWPSDPFFPDGFPWVEWSFPQPLHGNIMNVTVASHPMVPMSFSLTRTNWVNWGRGWNPDIAENISEDVDRGTFFQKQWDYAIQTNPDMISIGGWNEWIAYKQPYEGEYMMCDAVNKEYSRDIEPMAGGYQDAFYIQMIRNIRKYKGVCKPEKKRKKQTVDITGDISQWEKVEYCLMNIGSDDTERNSYGASTKVHYQQTAPENILQEVKVANDKNNIYFYIRGSNNFELNNEYNQPNILIGTGNPELKEWECYEYRIGRNFDGFHVSVDTIGRNFSMVSAGSASFTVNGKILQIQIPRKTIGLEKEDAFYFKVASGVENPANIMSYYTSGSVMPMGRLSYMYRMY